MTAHTPGPWAVWPMGRILAITCTGRSKPHPSEGMHVAAVHMPEHNTQHDELWHANARLIAAAPELLSCLKFAVKLLVGLPHIGGTAQLDHMRAVIAKATGEQP